MTTHNNEEIDRKGIGRKREGGAKNLGHDLQLKEVLHFHFKMGRGSFFGWWTAAAAGFEEKKKPQSFSLEAQRFEKTNYKMV